MQNRAPEHWGKIQVYTGDGKGKTTAALGTAMRALATGKRVMIIYFDKGGEHYSERQLLSTIARSEATKQSHLDFIATGLDRIDPVTGRFRFGVTDEDKAEGARGLQSATEAIMGGSYDLVVLDEVNSSLSLGIIPLQPVLDLLDHKPPHVEIICTGRGAPTELCDRAELVTNMQMVKHYFYHGASAREGLDF